MSPHIFGFITAILFLLLVVGVPSWWFWNRCENCHKKMLPLRKRAPEFGEFSRCNHCGAEEVIAGMVPFVIEARKMKKTNTQEVNCGKARDNWR